MVVVILGVPYVIERSDPSADDALASIDGYCDSTTKRIVVTTEEYNGADRLDDIDAFRNKQIRHEIVHAFLSESGLEENSGWADNEEIVDWIAMQGPKIYKAWQEANAI